MLGFCFVWYLFNVSMTILQASADPEPAAASLNRNDNEKNDKSKNDGANDNMTRSEVEVRTDDQTNVPISNNEAPRLERHDQKSDAAAAEGGMCSSYQGLVKLLWLERNSLSLVFS